jgi:hypothetical protein
MGVDWWHERSRGGRDREERGKRDRKKGDIPVYHEEHDTFVKEKEGKGKREER